MPQMEPDIPPPRVVGSGASRTRLGAQARYRGERAIGLPRAAFAPRSAFTSLNFQGRKSAKDSVQN